MLTPQFSKSADQSFSKAKGQSDIILTRKVAAPWGKPGENHVLIIGEDEGQLRNVALTNIQQAYGSYIVVDPGGVLYQETGEFLKEKGYDVRKLDFCCPDGSAHYNPLRYLTTEQDAEDLAENLQYDGEKKKFVTDPYYAESEKSLFEGLVGYMRNHIPSESPERNLQELCRMLSLPLDELHQIFDGLEDADPDDPCVKAYHFFRIGASRTANAIKGYAHSRISALCAESGEILQDDTVCLDTVGYGPTAIFLITPEEMYRASQVLPTVRAFLHQAITLTQAADHPTEYPVRMLLLDFPHVYGVHSFPVQMVHSYAYGPSFMLFARSIAELKEKYPGGNDYRWTDIQQQCPYLLYLGCSDPDTQKEVAKIVETTSSKMEKPILFSQAVGIFTD